MGVSAVDEIGPAQIARDLEQAPLRLAVDILRPALVRQGDDHVRTPRACTVDGPLDAIGGGGDRDLPTRLGIDEVARADHLGGVLGVHTHDADAHPAAAQHDQVAYAGPLTPQGSQGRVVGDHPPEVRGIHDAAQVLERTVMLVVAEAGHIQAHEPECLDRGELLEESRDRG